MISSDFSKSSYLHSIFLPSVTPSFDVSDYSIITDVNRSPITDNRSSSSRIPEFSSSETIHHGHDYQQQPLPVLRQSTRTRVAPTYLQDY